MIKAAEAAEVPITLVPIDDSRARELYERDLVLIRPDHPIAWRGNSVMGDPAHIIARVTGWPS